MFPDMAESEPDKTEDQALVTDTGRYGAFWVSMFILCRCSTSMLDMEV